jgi:diguanylate cyclase (GGDEF)-like protein
VPRPGAFARALLRVETRGWVLASFLAGFSVVVAALAVAPVSGIAPHGREAWVALGLAALAVVAAVARRRTERLWAVVAVTVGLSTWLLAESRTLVDAGLTLVSFTYVVIFVSYAFEGWWRHGALLLVTVASAVGFARSPLAPRWIVWLAGVLGVVLAGAVLGHVMRLLRWYATTDTLTGALTRSAFAASAGPTIAGSRRRGEPAVVVVLDLDDFKAVNDSRGHAAGDEVLAGTVEAWRGRLRGQDVLGRVGGDEFVLLLPDTELDGARRLIDDLAGASPVAFSAGLALCGAEDSLDALLERADAGMYAVKRSRPGELP